MAYILRAGSRIVRPEPGRKVVKAADYASLRQADAIIADAETQAKQILASAQQAYEAEKARGYADGRDEAQIEAAERMIETTSRTIDYFSKIEGQMVELVLGAVRKIFEDFEDDQRVIMVVKSALAAVRNQKQMNLRVPPAHVENVRAHVNELLAAYPGIGYLDITADARLTGDACILESEIGIVEASVESQIAALKGTFMKILGAKDG
ncbi:MAG TPA: HrpE/YscL family type III secretion apparatus protein [Usitatibacter sp.]|nr:HrpE/YscL family type III secretion apparatus protein [Usitatibacter sp.]